MDHDENLDDKYGRELRYDDEDDEREAYRGPRREFEASEFIFKLLKVFGCTALAIIALLFAVGFELFLVCGQPFSSRS
ncbi:MAG: hypothetical protein R3C18_25190 [Planctomycetaceae bacterium]